MENILFNFKSDRYVLEKYIGRGSWGEVYSAKDLKKEEYVAIKILNPSDGAKNQMTERELNLFEAIIKETISFKNMNNLNIVHRHLEYDNNDKEFIVMSLYGTKEKNYQDSTLESIVKNKYYKNGLDLKIIHKIIRDTANGISEVHKNLKRAHSDIKPDNFAVIGNENNLEKILVLDLGTTTYFNNDEHNNIRKNMGCLYTRSPENYYRKPDEKSDIWALGSLYYKLFTGKYIFEDELNDSDNPGELMKNLSNEEGNKLIKQKFKENKKLIPKHLRKSLEKCLNFNPEKRYSNGNELYNIINKDINFFEKNTPLRKFTLYGLTALISIPLAIGIFNYQKIKQDSFLEKQKLENKIDKIIWETDVKDTLMLFLKNNQKEFLSTRPFEIDDSFSKFEIEYAYFDVGLKSGFENYNMAVKNRINQEFYEENKNLRLKLIKSNLFDKKSLNLIDSLYFNYLDEIRNNYYYLYKKDSLIRYEINKNKNISINNLRTLLEDYYGELNNYKKKHIQFMNKTEYVSDFINNINNINNRKNTINEFDLFFETKWYFDLKKTNNLSKEEIIKKMVPMFEEYEGKDFERGQFPTFNKEINKYAKKLSKDKINNKFFEYINDSISWGEKKNEFLRIYWLLSSFNEELKEDYKIKKYVNMMEKGEDIIETNKKGYHIEIRW
jgi:serine/threonine protein kinase